ncbi:MAG: peptide chain release factor N(5)-glutamine methyltransferase [Chitinophagaceae bacterium]
MFVTMTIHEASQQLRFQLFHVYDEREAGNITGLVMENITGWKKIDRVVNKTVPLSACQQQLFENYTKALLENKPLQYVLHEAWFYGMCLYVDENVLIPRPETEELADWVVKDYKSSLLTVRGSGSGTKNVLDIGTGSGCIALAIKKILPSVNMHSCDISEAALNVAKKNASDQKLGIHFHLLDILSGKDCSQMPVFDIIISNPPYIPEKDKNNMEANVLQYEPHLALFVENTDPLLFYKAIACFAKLNLAKNGIIYLEIHEELAGAVTDLYIQNGFTNIELKEDLQGRDRMIKVQ